MSQTDTVPGSLRLVEVMTLTRYADETVLSRKQMKELLDVASVPDQEGLRDRDRRYLDREIVGALTAIELLKTQFGWATGKVPVKLVRLRKAVTRLWDLGVTYPLTKDVLAWDSATRQYVLLFDGLLVDAATGQLRIEALLNEQDLEPHERAEALDWARIALRPRPVEKQSGLRLTAPTGAEKLTLFLGT